MKADFDSEAPDDNRKTCVDCGSRSPPSDANSTMISVQHGWRLVSWRDRSGRAVGQWRCPKCWKKHREASGKG